ncbi:MAG: hypothetical protein AB7G93_05090 [Bdellovibrionales bacterium]
MRKMVGFGILLCVSVTVHAKGLRASKTGRAPASGSWAPLSYEKVVLPGKVPEGVIFIKNGSKGKIAYSASYFVGDQVLRTRVIPREIYTSMKESLRRDVLTYAAKGFDGTCSNSIVMINGEIIKKGGKRIAKDKRLTPVCLSQPARYGRAVSESFKGWYSKARSVFSL